MAKPAQPELSTALGSERMPVPDISPMMNTAAVNMVRPLRGGRPALSFSAQALHLDV